MTPFGLATASYYIVIEPNKPAVKMNYATAHIYGILTPLGSLCYALEAQKWYRRAMVNLDTYTAVSRWMYIDSKEVSDHNKLQVLLLTS